MNISFKLTTQQIREKTKFVTRRNGWDKVKVGQILTAIVQGQGLKKGQKVERLCQIRVAEVWREPVNAILMPSHALEPALEGFPEWTQADFLQFYCKANRCKPDKIITRNGVTAVFLDPPYADTAQRADQLYACDSLSVAHDVRAWAIENGENPKLKIALCGYEGEHSLPESWECVHWDAGLGFGSRAKGEKKNSNGKRERIWFSPHCQRSHGLFD